MNKKVLVAMSGGVDSSVAAIMLKEQGYSIYGVTMKTWDYKGTPKFKKKVIGCCNLDSINDAREVAVKYDFPHIILDIRKDFGNYVVSNFKSEYLKGRTPNPCILCNTHIKWEALLEKAKILGCDYIATGHYAQVKKKDNRYFVTKGIDSNKDQSYALWGLSQESLKKTLLPLGKYKKPDIKDFAIQKGFENIAKKSESYEICFIPDNDYRNFLKNSIDDIDKEKIKEGDFIFEDGTVVGRHKGYPFYTVGQRKGLGLALGYPVYVVEIKTNQNAIVVGKLDELSRNGMYVTKLNMMKYPNINGILDTVTKVRYNDVGSPSVIEQDNDTMKVFFGTDVKAITPGQAAVFYEDDDVVGGGWIDSSFKKK